MTTSIRIPLLIFLSVDVRRAMEISNFTHTVDFPVGIRISNKTCKFVNQNKTKKNKSKVQIHFFYIPLRFVANQRNRFTEPSTRTRSPWYFFDDRFVTPFASLIEKPKTKQKTFRARYARRVSYLNEPKGRGGVANGFFHFVFFSSNEPVRYVSAKPLSSGRPRPAGVRARKRCILCAHGNNLNPPPSTSGVR